MYQKEHFSEGEGVKRKLKCWKDRMEGSRTERDIATTRMKSKHREEDKIAKELETVRTLSPSIHSPKKML